MSLFRPRPILAVLALAVLATPSHGGQAARIAPHEGIYNIRLSKISPGGNLVSVKGTMTYKVEETCDGWITENRTAMRFDHGEHGAVETTWSYSSWEDKTGAQFRFRTRHARDGAVTEALDGSVTRRSDGTSVVAYRAPEGQNPAPNPSGTLFPIEHVKALLKAARDGQAVLPRTVFDGTSLDNPYEINAVIGRQRPGQARKDLGAGPVWPIRMAFFPVATKRPEPDFELEVLYRADGIATWIHQDFGDFAIDMELQGIKALPSPGC